MVPSNKQNVRKRNALHGLAPADHDLAFVECQVKRGLMDLWSS